MMLLRLSYVSSVSMRGAASLPSSMEDILLASVANNRRDDISGFLVCDGFEFAQILEGPQAEVEACFGRIRGDDRNVEVRQKDRKPETGRAFPRWSMCGLTLSAMDDALLTAPELGYQFSRLSPGALEQRLESLGLRYRERLDAEHQRLLDRARAGGPSQ